MPNFEQNYNVVRKAPKIEIDSGKCTTPLACRRCALICPQVVFYVDRAAPFPRLAEFDVNDPGKYVMNTKCDYACIGCNECIEVCPVDAITITWQ